MSTFKILLPAIGLPFLTPPFSTIFFSLGSCNSVFVLIGNFSFAISVPAPALTCAFKILSTSF
jgi:hypothetical protein